MGAREFRAQDRVARSGFKGCRNGPHGLGNDAIGSTVQETEGLGVALNRHGGNDSTGLGFGDDDAELLVEGTAGQALGIHSLSLGDTCCPYDA